MDTQRLILFVVFSFSAFLLWQKWETSHRPPSVAPIAQSAGTEAAKSAVPSPSAKDAVGVAPQLPGSEARLAAKAGEIIAISTDLYRAEIDTLGGVIAQVALLKHRESADESKPYLALLRTPERTFVAETGLLGQGMPNHQTPFVAVPGPREFAPGSDRLELKLEATAAGGEKITKTFTFHRDSYVIDVAFDIANNGAAAISPYAYFQFVRDTKSEAPHNSMAPASYTGPVVYDEADKYKKVDFKEIDKLAEDENRKLPYTKNNDNGWVGMVEHYYVAAWLPSDEKKTTREFYTKKLDGGLYSAGVVLPVGTIAPGATGVIAVPLYVGPQDQEVLGKLAKGLDLTVDYGIFTVIAAPLFWLLKWLHSLIGNWGWAIIAMTIIIKSAFYPLNHASARSMAKMKLIAPRLKSLQAQYADDKQQLQVKMMEMYKQEKINPLGGCLPILVQIPVFIALYWVLLSAVELRHAPWILWIKDLSAPDPFFVLPVVYAVTAFLQVKLSPTPISDPVQAKVMQIMPIAFSVMFVFFPSGLVLYWLVNNCIQIFQQWHMNRLLEKEAAVAAAKRR